MADKKRVEESAKILEIEILRKMGIDVILDKDEFNRVLKANEKLQKMELELGELFKLNSELNSLKDEKKTVDENNQILKEFSIERGKQNFAEFIEAAKAMKEFIPVTTNLRNFTYWDEINKITLSLNNQLEEDDKTKYLLTLAKDSENNIVCIQNTAINEASIYFNEKENVVNETKKVWFLYDIFSSSNRIDELKTAIKENLEKRVGTTKEQLNNAHKELHEAEKAAQKANLLSKSQSEEYSEIKKLNNNINISSDEFLELSRSIDFKSFEFFADRIQAESAEYWTDMACIQIEEYNYNQLKWILENREVRFDEITRNNVLNEKLSEKTNIFENLPLWAAVSDDPVIIDTVFSKMTEKDFAWAKEHDVFKKAEDFYNEKIMDNPQEKNNSVAFGTLKNWVKQYNPEIFTENSVRHFYARQVPPEDSYYNIDEELSALEISIIETYPGSRYLEIINNDIPNGSMSQFADTMNEILDDFDTFFKNGGKPSEQELKDGRAQYASLEKAVNIEFPKKDGSKYTEKEMKEWHDVFNRYEKAGNMGRYWSTTKATHEVLAQVMELQTGEPFVLASLKGSSQGEDVTAVIPEKLYSNEFVEDIEAKYWNEGIEYLVYEDNSGKVLTFEELQEYAENNSLSYYLPSYKSAEKLADALGAKKGELTIYDFEGYEKIPKYEKVQYMKTLKNPFDDLRTVLNAYNKGFDSKFELDDYDKNRVKKGKWSIVTGAYAQSWELYYENTPVASCNTDNILEGYGKDFNGFTETDMLRVVTQEYKNIKCPKIIPPSVEDYEKYLNDYFHDGSFTLKPENAFDEYPFEDLLNKNLERHYHYEKDSVGGVILSYDFSNHTEYLQPGDDAKAFLSDVEKIEDGVIQINAEKQLDNLIDNYFPDFFPNNFRDEDTKKFITQQKIIYAVNNYECGKLYREYDPKGFEEDAQKWIAEHSPAFTNVSEMPKTENQISNGQILGFVKNNKIYINIDSFNSETPIHEYTHLWDKAVQKTNPNLWKQGVALLKKTDTWKEIERNPAYADIAGNEDLLASEVHARLTGKDGAELFKNISEDVKKNVGTVLYDLRKELSEKFCSNRINDVQPFRDDLKKIHDTNFAGINFEVSAKEWTPIRIQQVCEEICDKLGLEYLDVTSNYPREDNTVLSNNTYFVNLSVCGFRKLPLQHVISSDEIKQATYKWNEDSWNYIRDNFTEWKDGNLKPVKELSVNDFVNITLKDFVDGKNPIPHITENIEQENIQMQYEIKTHDEYSLMSNYGYGWEEEVGYDNLEQARNDLKTYRENGGGNYHLKHHTRVPNGFTVEDGYYVPTNDITPKNFKDYLKASLKLRQVAGNPQKAAAYCLKHANNQADVEKWLIKQGCTSKENSDKIFEHWANEEIKSEQSKSKTKSNLKDNENWSISD